MNLWYIFHRSLAKMMVVTAITSVLLLHPSYALHRGGKDLPYGQALSHPLDKPVNDMYNGKAFFMNLGPTGVRARIDPENPKAFLVTYVFQDEKSPARGKVGIGEMIVGANGKLFETPHGFHRKKPGARGWQGPPFELALAIEDSQGKDGKLELLVTYAGHQGEPKKVVIQLEQVGRFSKTYPWDCERSDKLRASLVDFLIETGTKGGHHHQVQQLLAVLSSGDPRALPLVAQKAQEIMKQTPKPSDKAMCTWNWGYSGIFLSEYYNKTGDETVLPAVKGLNRCFELGMDYGAGSFSHRPFPFISQRASDTGVKGYGALAGTGGLAMLAQSTFKAVGLPYSNQAYSRTHQSYLMSVGHDNPQASIAYGFKSWQSLLIRLQDPKTPCFSGKGNGYRCPTGMKDIGPFVAEEWKKKDGKWNMTLVPSTNYPWLVTEADNLLVYEHNIYVDPSVMQRKVYRPIPTEEPTKPYKTEPGGGGHVAPMGMGAAAHFVGNKGNSSWNFLGQHLANGTALSPGMLFDGHADAVMHGFFSVVGAAHADKESLRTYLDYVKTLIILSEPHDGQGLVEQPFGCQRNATCSIARNRVAYTHVMVMLLSMHKKQLLILGAEPRVGRKTEN